jgi:short subunit dehydrogenase-like uncharacterized protein
MTLHASGAPRWMLYGAGGYTGALIAQHARERGHEPLLAGRRPPAVTALAEQLDLPHRTLTLDDPAALPAALAGVDVVLNAAGPFLHTAAPLAEACLRAGVHYLDISNELRVFLALYGLHDEARRAGVTIIPGVGFGVVATNFLARYVSDAVGDADHVEVATRAAVAEGGPGVAATREANISYGGWTRRAGELQPEPLGEGITTITLPDGPCLAMPVPTGDLEAAYRATGAPHVTAYVAVADPQGAGVGPGDPAATDGPAGANHRSYGWARATRADGVSAEAWLQTGESYAFTAAAAVHAVEEALWEASPGAFSPAEVFGADFPLSLPGTSRLDDLTPPRRAVRTPGGGG